MINPLKRLKRSFRSLTTPWWLAWRLIFHTPNMQLDADHAYVKYWQAKRPDGLGKLSPFQQQRAQWISRFIAPGSSITDIGCGDGGVIGFLKDEVPGIQFTAVDFSEEILNHLANLGIPTMHADLTKSEQWEQFPQADYFILFEIIEHLANSEQLVKHLLGKANKGVFISVPNTGYFPYRIRALLGRVPMQWRLMPNEHLRFWTYKDMRWWLEQLGYQDSKLHLYEGIPVLNRIWGAMFAMGMVVYIPANPSRHS